MTPNIDGPKGTETISEESQSSDHQTNLEFIESSLNQLKRNTLKMKRRNDEIIRSFDRRSVSVADVGEPIAGSSSSSSCVDAPPKPPRRRNSTVLLPYVEQVLRDSDLVKKKMQDTLRLCAESREKNQKTLDEMRRQSEQRELSPLRNISNKPLQPAASASLVSLNPASSFMRGVKQSFIGAFQKLNSSNNINSQGISESESKTERKPMQPSSDSNSDILVASEVKENFIKPLPPKPKPRTKTTKLSVNLNVGEANISKGQPGVKIRKPVQPPPPPPAPILSKDSVTYDELINMYKNQTDDLSLPRPSRIPPIPKPRTKLPSTVSALSITKQTSINEQPVSECDESSSEFEYVVNPLIVSTVAVSDDSDESLIITENSPTSNIISTINGPTNKYVKNLKKINKGSPPARPYRKPKLEQTPLESIKQIPSLKEVPRMSVPKPKIQKFRPSSPPPPMLTRVPSLPYLMEKLSEEEDSLTKNKIPSEPEVNLPIPMSQNETTKEEDIPFKLVKSRPSALCSDVPDVPVIPVNIPVNPWIVQDRPTRYTVLSSPFNETPETDSTEEEVLSVEHPKANPHPSIYPSLPNDLTLSNNPLKEEDNNRIETTIHESFAFLDTEESTEAELSDVPQNISEHESSIEEIIEKSCIYITYSSIMETEVNVQNIPCSNVLSNTEKIESVEKRPPPLPQSPPPTLPEILPGNDLPVSGSFSSPSQLMSAPPPPAMPLTPIYSDTFKLNKTKFINLPITPLDDVSCKTTIFDTLKSVDPEKFQLDLKFIEENFHLNSPELENKRLSMGRKLNNTTDSSNQSAVSLLSHNRRNAIAIGARKLKQSTIEIENALKGLNFEQLSSDDIQILLQMLPKENERSVFESVDGQNRESLCKEDQLVKSLTEIPRAPIKLEAINFMLGFDETIKTLESEICIVQNATRSIKESKKFLKMLEIVLLVINKAFVKDAEPVKGFQIQSLHRLASKKSADGKLSLLHYIVKCLENSSPDDARFYEDFKNVEEASKISDTEFSKVLDETGKGIEKIKQEITAIEGENPDAPDGISKASNFIKAAYDKFTEVKRNWNMALEELKNLTEYFGVSNKSPIDLIEFFKIISTFVNDYKKVQSQTNKLFHPNETERDSTGHSKHNVSETAGSSDVLNTNVILRPRAFSGSVQPGVSNQRKSLGNIESTIREIQKDIDQPSEFLNAMGRMPTQEKLRRRRSLYTSNSRSPKKTTHVLEENRER